MYTDKFEKFLDNIKLALLTIRYVIYRQIRKVREKKEG